MRRQTMTQRFLSLGNQDTERRVGLTYHRQTSEIDYPLNVQRSKSLSRQTTVEY